MTSVYCRAILFDLDGTLVDSAARLRRLWQAWGKRHSIDFDTLLTVMHGRRAVETIRAVAPHLQAEREVEALESEEIADMLGVWVYPSVPELLGNLSPAQWAIVTSGSRRVAEARMKYVKLPIPPVFITGDDVRKGKPGPDGYLLAARCLQVEPIDCVVIEDSPAGVEAGKMAEMRVIGVTTTHNATQLQGADIIIGELAELSLSVGGNSLILQRRS